MDRRDEHADFISSTRCTLDFRGVLAGTDRIGILQRAVTQSSRRFPKANGVIKT